MRLWVALVGVAAAVVLGLAFALHGPAPTGIESEAKSPEGPDAVASFLEDSVAWRGWTEDEAVQRLVDAPIKWRGLGEFDADARIALKTVMAEAEGRIRSTMRAFHARDLDARSARAELEDAFREYSDALEELSGAR